MNWLDLSPDNRALDSSFYGVRGIRAYLHADQCNFEPRPHFPFDSAALRLWGAVLGAIGCPLAHPAQARSDDRSRPSRVLACL